MTYANRALAETELRYAKIEKEMFALVFSLEKFHFSTYMVGGQRFTLTTIEHSEETSCEKAPKRLQGMLLRTPKYDINLVYVKGNYINRRHAITIIFDR